jgi:Ni,Fe-hydrogenase I large subunit
MTATVSTKRMDLHVSPLGRVEGDLDLRVTVEDGVVTQAWTEAGMFRGFEMILKGKDPQAGLIVTPRICGICGGSHLYKSAFALDVAWRTELPPNALLIRNIAQACETLQSVPRWFYALFAIDLTNRRYAKAKGYDEAVRRFAPLVGESYERGVTLSAKPVEIYAIFGGQWPHSSFMIPGGVMCGPTLSDVTRSIAILEEFRHNWLESRFLGCSVDRWLEIKTWEDMLAWVDENESQHNSDLGFFLRFGLEIGLDRFGAGCGNYLAMGTYLHPEKYNHPTIEGRNAALIQRSGIYAGGKHYEFDQARVREDHTHSFYQGSGLLHPFEGRTEPIDPAEAKRQGKYTWAKAPRYEVDGLGYVPLEVVRWRGRWLQASRVKTGRMLIRSSPTLSPKRDRVCWCAPWRACTKRPNCTRTFVNGWDRSICTIASTSNRLSTSLAEGLVRPRRRVARSPTGSYWRTARSPTTRS